MRFRIIDLILWQLIRTCIIMIFVKLQILIYVVTKLIMLVGQWKGNFGILKERVTVVINKRDLL